MGSSRHLQIPDIILKQSLRSFFDSLSPLMVATDGVDNYIFKASSKSQPLTLLTLLNKLLDSAGYTLGAVAERELETQSLRRAAAARVAAKAEVRHDVEQSDKRPIVS